eukprot:768393-Hanusia_phi.AAC.6
MEWEGKANEKGHWERGADGRRIALCKARLRSPLVFSLMFTYNHPVPYHLIHRCPFPFLLPLLRPSANSCRTRDTCTQSSLFTETKSLQQLYRIDVTMRILAVCQTWEEAEITIQITEYTEKPTDWQWMKFVMMGEVRILSEPGNDAPALDFQEP